MTDEEKAQHASELQELVDLLASMTPEQQAQFTQQAATVVQQFING